MRRFLSFFLLQWIIIPMAISQDMIIMPDIVYQSTDCKIISADKDNVAYKTSGIDIVNTLSTDKIARINFSDTSDQIIRPFLVYDTIRCEILSITPENVVYFSSKDYVNYSIPKSDVLACFFNGTCASPEYDEYAGKFQQLHDYAKSKKANLIVKKDGSEIQTSGVEIDDKNFYFELYQNESNIQTFIDRSKVRSFIYSEYKTKPSRYSSSNYLLSTGGRLLECTITKIDTSKLELETIINENIVNSELVKDKVCALFFGTPAIDFTKPTPVTYQSTPGQSGSGANTKVEFGLCGIWGYRYSPINSDMPSSLSDYVNKLRSGFGVSGNFNLFVSYNASIGITYKFMNSHNSIDDININGITSTSDKINIHFVGMNFQYSSARRNRFNYDFAVAGGYVSYKDNATLNHVAVQLTGTSFGLSLTNRFNLIVDNNAGFFFDVSVFLSSLSKYKFEDQTIDLEEPDNLSRFEVGIGIKFMSN